MGWGMADDIDSLLKGWGLYYGERTRVRYSGSREPPDVHPLARARAFAPGKKDKRQAQHRAGYDRRRYMAAALEFLHIVPGGFVDPVPCKETHSFRLVTEQPVPPVLVRVEQAAKDLEGIDLLRALCLRARYCVEGTDADRALWATLELRKSSHYAQDISAATMRAEAAFARAWMAGKLGAAMLRPSTPLPAAREG
jgi:hypothetical protein